MRVKRVELRQSIYLPKQYLPQGFKEIAVVGRSNAGKSSLINALCNRKIAKVSQQPGKSRSINAYLINEAFLLMDLPGYGYAKSSQKEQKRWGDLINGYFQSTEALCHLLLLCDIRHDAGKGDVMMAEWLQHYGIEYTLIATKADKIAKSKRAQYLSRLKKQVGDPPSMCFSAIDGTGREELESYIGHILNVL